MSPWLGPETRDINSKFDTSTNIITGTHHRGRDPRPGKKIADRCAPVVVVEDALKAMRIIYNRHIIDPVVETVVAKRHSEAMFFFDVGIL